MSSTVHGESCLNNHHHNYCSCDSALHRSVYISDFFLLVYYSVETQLTLIFEDDVALMKLKRLRPPLYGLDLRSNSSESTVIPALSYVLKLNQSSPRQNMSWQGPTN